MKENDKSIVTEAAKQIVTDVCGDEQCLPELIPIIQSALDKSRQEEKALLTRCRDWITEHGQYAEDKGLIYLPLLREINSVLGNEAPTPMGQETETGYDLKARQLIAELQSFRWISDTISPPEKLALEQLIAQRFGENEMGKITVQTPALASLQDQRAQVSEWAGALSDKHLADDLPPKKEVDQETGLAPCPFCGGDAIHETRPFLPESTEGDKIDWHFIHCPGALSGDGIICDIQPRTNGFTNFKAASDSWNHRVQGSGQKELHDHLNWAWSILANAGGGDWGKESPDWQEAVTKWRDKYHEILESNSASRATPTPQTNVVSEESGELLSQLKDSIANTLNHDGDYTDEDEHDCYCVRCCAIRFVHGSETGTVAAPSVSLSEKETCPDCKQPLTGDYDLDREVHGRCSSQGEPAVSPETAVQEKALQFVKEMSDSFGFPVNDESDEQFRQILSATAKLLASVVHPDTKHATEVFADVVLELVNFLESHYHDDYHPQYHEKLDKIKHARLLLKLRECGKLETVITRHDLSEARIKSVRDAAISDTQEEAT